MIDDTSTNVAHRHKSKSVVAFRLTLPVVEALSNILHNLSKSGASDRSSLFSPRSTLGALTNSEKTPKQSHFHIDASASNGARSRSNTRCEEQPVSTFQALRQQGEQGHETLQKRQTGSESVVGLVNHVPLEHVHSRNAHQLLRRAILECIDAAVVILKEQITLLRRINDENHSPAIRRRRQRLLCAW